MNDQNLYKEQRKEASNNQQYENSFTQKDVLACLLKKQQQMCARLDQEENLESVKTLVEVIDKLQEAIQKCTDLIQSTS